MRLLSICLAAAALVLAVAPAEAQIVAPAITAPSAGQVLRGQVAISGSTDVPNFSSAELDFGYAGDSTGTWFAIAVFTTPSAGGTLATWDTTSISDGAYVLRLRVTLQDGTFLQSTVDVRVQNETPLPTDTPTSTATPPATVAPTASSTPSLTPVPTATTAATEAPTPTGLPANPASVTSRDVTANAERGAVLTALLFAAVLIVLRVRRY